MTPAGRGYRLKKMISPTTAHILSASKNFGTPAAPIYEIRDFSPYRARMPRSERRRLDRLLRKRENFDLDLPSIGLHLEVRGDLFMAMPIAARGAK